MRRVIVGVAAAACVMGVVGSLAYVLTAGTTQDNAQNWRQHRLAFLKSTYDRIQADIAVGGSAAPSSRKQAESVLRDMDAIAKPMPPESIPSDIRMLLSASAPREKGSEAAIIGPVKESVVAEPISDLPIAHPSGISIQLRTIALNRDSITLSATIANLSDRTIRLNRARHLVLVDSAYGVHHLNPPLENAEFKIPPHTQMSGDLVFIGPTAPSVHHLTLSTNDGVGTPDNPDDGDPSLKAEIPVNDGGDSADEQANDPGGVAVRVGQIFGGPASCAIPLLATNGTEHTIALSENVNLTLADEQGASVQVEPPPENRQLIVPPGARLEAELVFGCGQLDLTAGLTLTTNQDNTAAMDKANDSPPRLKLKVASDLKGDGSTVASSRASIALIVRSQLAATAVAAAPPSDDGSAASPQTAVALTPQRTDASPEAPSGRDVPEASSSSEQPEAPPATPDPSRRLSELENALHAEKTDRGLRVILPADSLFASTDDVLEPAADPPLSSLAGLIRAMGPRVIVINVHSDVSGDNAASLALSKKRAHAVAAWLLAHGAEHQPHFVERGYGNARPVAPKTNAEGSDNTEGPQQERRIEVLLRRN